MRVFLLLSVCWLPSLGCAGLSSEVREATQAGRLPVVVDEEDIYRKERFHGPLIVVGEDGLLSLSRAGFGVFRSRYLGQEAEFEQDRVTEVLEAIDPKRRLAAVDAIRSVTDFCAAQDGVPEAAQKVLRRALVSLEDSGLVHAVAERIEHDPVCGLILGFLDARIASDDRSRTVVVVLKNGRLTAGGATVPSAWYFPVTSGSASAAGASPMQRRAESSRWLSLLPDYRRWKPEFAFSFAFEWPRISMKDPRMSYSLMVWSLPPIGEVPPGQVEYEFD